MNITQDQAINLYIAELRDSQLELSWADISDRVLDKFDFELTGNAARKRYSRLPSDSYGIDIEALADIGSVGEEINLSYNVRTLDLGEDQSLIDYVLGQANIQPSTVNVTRSNIKRFNTPLKDGADRTILAENWSVTLSLQPVGAGVSPQDLLDEIARIAPDKWPAAPKRNTGKLFVPSLYDLHLEKLAASQYPDENMAEVYLRVLVDLIDKAVRAGGFDRTIFVVGNDLGNVDNLLMATTAGTIVENKTGYHTGAKERCALMVTAINLLLKYAPVDIIVVPGNHDRSTSYWLGLYLEAWFRDNKDVEFTNHGNDIEWYRWGQTMFMFTHGERVKHDKVAPFMAVEQPIMFTQCKHRELYMGHFHTYKRLGVQVTDEHGVLVRWMPGLSSTDKWHRDHWFVGNNRAGVGILYDKKHGPEFEITAFV